MSNERQKLSENQFEVKPMKLYHTSNIKFDDINEGDVLVAKLEAFGDNKLFLNVGGIKAEMLLEDYDFTPESKTAKAVISFIGENVLARVKKKEDNLLILERRTIVNETMKRLISNVGNVVDATVKTIASFALFVDIGNGIVSMVHIYEVSKCRYDNLSKFFKPGNHIKVKIMEFEPETSHFVLSRKEAYGKMDMPEGYIVNVRITNFIDEEKSGIFVEYNPGNAGIMDVPEDMSPDDFEFGEMATVQVKKIIDKGFKCRFIRKC